MPAVESRTQMPRRRWPVSSVAGSTVAVRSWPSRTYSTVSAPSPLLRTASVRSCMESMDAPLTRLIRSPELSPASRAGLTVVPSGR